MACKAIDEQEILERYQQDETLTITQLAKEYEVSRARIRRVLVENNVVTRKTKRLTKKQREEILEKYFGQLATSYGLAKEYELNYTSVRKIIMKDPRYETVKKSKQRLEQEEKEAIIREYLEKDITHMELAKRYGHTRSWITHLIQKTDVEGLKKKKDFKNRKETPKRRLKVSAEVLIEELKKPMVSQRLLAEKYGVSESAIYHAIARYRGKRD